MTDKQKEWIKTAADAALMTEHECKVPASLTLAQACLESGYGAHCPGNNALGIKQYPGCYGTRSLETQEEIDGELRTVVQVFATFATLKDCFEKHAQLLTSGHPYSTAWSKYLVSRNVESLTLQIAPIYATDPQYGAKLLSIMRSPAITTVLA